MAYLCVDRRGEFIADEKPEKGFHEWCGWEDLYSKCTLISIPKGTIKKLIGKDLTWEDGSICLEEFVYLNGEL